jgi:hypothetical protein
MAKMKNRRFLRFVGKLWETGEFEPGIGWETTRISRRPCCTTGYTLQLLDGAGKVLVEAGIEQRVPTCQVQGTHGVTGKKIIGYLPFDGRGRKIIFRQGDLIRYQIEIAATSPHIEITSLEIDGNGCVHVRWNAEHERALWFNVVFVDAKRRAISVARELSDSHLTFATAELPGGPGCSIAVLATDGLRSSMARSEQFDLPQQPLRLVIMMPNDGDYVAPDHPISLLGNAHDMAGRALPDDALVWSIDNRVVARGQRMAPAGPFEPGLHCVELAYLSGDDVVACTQVKIRVPERSPEQHAWRTISARRTHKSAKDDKSC